MKTKKHKFLIVVTLVIIGVAIYRYFNEDLTVLNDARTGSDMQMIESDLGYFRLQAYGDTNNPTVILVHSFNGFIESWQPNIGALVDAGYHVVAYDLFGRGLSDRPWVDYDLTLFRRQLVSVLNAVKVEKAHLIGSSFGAVISADFTIHHPEKVKELVLIGPAGWPSEDGRNALLDVPVLGELVFHYFGENILLPKVKEYFLNPEKNVEMIEKWQFFAALPGSMRAALSTLRHAPVLDFSAGWKSLGELNLPVHFIWGKQDKSFPFENSRKIPELMPQAVTIGIENAAHWVNIEQASQVNSAMVEILESQDL